LLGIGQPKGHYYAYQAVYREPSMNQLQDHNADYLIIA